VAEEFNHLSPFPRGRFDEIAKMIDNSSGIDGVWTKSHRTIVRWIGCFQRNLEKIRLLSCNNNTEACRPNGDGRRFQQELSRPRSLVESTAYAALDGFTPNDNGSEIRL